MSFNREMSNRDQNCFFVPGCKHVYFCTKFDIFKRGFMGIDSLLNPALEVTGGSAVLGFISVPEVTAWSELKRWVDDVFLSR